MFCFTAVETQNPKKGFVLNSDVICPQTYIEISPCWHRKPLIFKAEPYLLISCHQYWSLPLSFGGCLHIEQLGRMVVLKLSSVFVICPFTLMSPQGGHPACVPLRCRNGSLGDVILLGPGSQEEQMVLDQAGNTNLRKGCERWKQLVWSKEKQKQWNCEERKSSATAQPPGKAERQGEAWDSPQSQRLFSLFFAWLCCLMLTGDLGLVFL